MKKLKILIGCERSGRVRDAFRELGHDAVSSDLQETIAPGPHYKGDVFDIIDEGWDMAIFHPPCTHLAVSGAKHFEKKKADGRQQQGIDLFMRFANCKIPRWAIENPIGIMSGIYRRPDQIVNPWMFGDAFQKTTCLWLHNLPPLFHWEGDSLFDFPQTHAESKGDFVEVINKKTGKIARLPKWYSNAPKIQTGRGAMSVVRPSLDWRKQWRSNGANYANME